MKGLEGSSKGDPERQRAHYSGPYNYNDLRPYPIIRRKLLQIITAGRSKYYMREIAVEMAELFIF